MRWDDMSMTWYDPSGKYQTSPLKDISFDIFSPPPQQPFNSTVPLRQAARALKLSWTRVDWVPMRGKCTCKHAETRYSKALRSAKLRCGAMRCSGLKSLCLKLLHLACRVEDIRCLLSLRPRCQSSNSCWIWVHGMGDGDARRWGVHDDRWLASLIQLQLFSDV